MRDFLIKFVHLIVPIFIGTLLHKFTTDDGIHVVEKKCEKQKVTMTRFLQNILKKKTFGKKSKYFFNKTYVHVDIIPWKETEVVEQPDVDSSEKGWRDQENPDDEE